MKGRLLILFVFCACAAAMIPRDRRALPSEEQTTSIDTERICASNTPCAWTVYKLYKESIEYNLTNTYCKCGPNTECRIYQDDASISASVHRCLPLEENENTES